jgi:acetyltransferase-like isoleucine patch superfamily enzyme
MVDRFHAFGDGPVLSHPLRADGAFSAQANQVWGPFLRGATVDETVFLGHAAYCKNCKSDPARITIGAHCVVRGLLRIEAHGDGHIALGEKVYLGDDVIVSASAGVTIGAGTLIAHGVQIFDNDSHPIDAGERARQWDAILGLGPNTPITIKAAPLTIGAQCWIGFNAILMKGATLGDRSVVAAGAVVTGPVPPDVVVAGNPARIVRHLTPA